MCGLGQQNDWCLLLLPTGASSSLPALHCLHDLATIHRPPPALPPACLSHCRWERSRTAGDAWAGRDLEAIRIDTLGRFKYCVLRVRWVLQGGVGAVGDALYRHAGALHVLCLCVLGGLPSRRLL